MTTILYFFFPELGITADEPYLTPRLIIDNDNGTRMAIDNPAERMVINTK